MAYQKAGYPYHPRPGKDIAPVKRHSVTMKVGETIKFPFVYCTVLNARVNLTIKRSFACSMQRSELASLYLAS